ncbi:hypothetical protein Mmc1_3613 [Magnetococcus marinus MC-1]|uniref:Sialidase domain-containing protein n=1 Tax=Magnetococcus marinus (strain ATCC BAA-1437 / JCM 17883 / MC-1) TaxID=156889 RepID=A0LDQ5_MAGMM|nr:hypothetical protein [Magnetococcus marinus]ABK46098.1 hypothetical protein Mmc1_3613 [Magnetococcus marinus MC-1]
MHWRLQQLWKRIRRKLHWPSALTHAQQPMITPTYEHSGQVTHPDVLDFGQPWQGYRFWMVTTPYPFLDESVENPSILVSHDGENWQPPEGLRNPLVERPTSGFHADPDMFFNPQQQQLWLYFLHTQRHQQQDLLRMCSADGRHWSPPVRILSLPYQTIRSPGLLWYRGEILMLSVNMSGGRILELRRSHNGVQWSQPQPVALTLPGYTPSHLDLLYDAPSALFFMLIQADPLGGGPNRLFLLSSKDPLVWRCGRRPLLSPLDAPSWAAQTLYRSSFSMHPDEHTVELWYAGRSMEHANHIAHLTIARRRWFKLANGPWFA